MFYKDKLICIFIRNETVSWNGGEIEHFEYEAQLYMYILYCRIKTPNFYIKINYNNFRASLVYKVHQLFHYHHNQKQRRSFILIICFSNCNAHIIQLTRIVANNLHVLRYTQERFFCYVFTYYFSVFGVCCCCFDCVIRARSGFSRKTFEFIDISGRGKAYEYSCVERKIKFEFSQ